MRSSLTAAAAVIFAATLAQADMVEKTSAGTVSQVMDRLEAAVTGAGATVFARIDHGGGAAGAGLELADAELLLFGNPMLGTPAMQADLRAGLHLPLRVLVHAGPDGGAVVVYETPATFFDGLDVPMDAEFVARMTGALDNLTNAAVSQ